MNRLIDPAFALRYVQDFISELCSCGSMLQCDRRYRQIVRSIGFRQRLEKFRKAVATAGYKYCSVLCVMSLNKKCRLLSSANLPLVYCTVVIAVGPGMTLHYAKKTSFNSALSCSVGSHSTVQSNLNCILYIDCPKHQLYKVLLYYW